MISRCFCKSLSKPASVSAMLVVQTAVLGGLLSLGGCRSTGGESGSGQNGGASTPAMTIDQRAEAVPMAADEYGKLGYRVEWRGFPTLLPGGRVESLDLLGDTIGAMDTEGVFTVLEAKSGQQRWSDQVAGPLTRFFGATRSGEQIIVASEAEFYYYDANTGTLKNKHRLAKVASTAPALVGDMAAYGTADSQVSGLLMLNGFNVWGSGVAGPVEFDPVKFSSGPEVAFASQGGDVLIIDGGTGRAFGRSHMFSGPGAALGNSESLVFVASTDHSLYAFSRTNGAQIWRHRTDAPLRKAPVHIEGVVYCDLGESGGMTALNASSGKVMWNNKDVSGEAVALRKNRVIVFNGAKAFALDPAKGKVLETVELTSVGFFRAENRKDGVLYAVSPLGVITKLSPK